MIIAIGSIIAVGMIWLPDVVQIRSWQSSVPSGSLAPPFSAAAWTFPQSAMPLADLLGETQPLARLNAFKLAGDKSSAGAPEATGVKKHMSNDRPVFQIIGSGRSDPGIARKGSPNEDSILVLTAATALQTPTQHSGLFVVADGMGGHANGKEASHLAIESIRQVVGPVLNMPFDPAIDYGEVLRLGGIQANSAIYLRNNALVSQGEGMLDNARHLMGSTLTAVLVVEQCAYVINVGDSRTYLYRKSEGGLRKLTNDHSIVAKMVQEGLIAPDDIYTHPMRNQIHRCLGDKPLVSIDLFKVPLQDQDTFLLCSDGLWEMVRDKEIQQILTASLDDVEQAGELLLHAALTNGGADNVSVVVVGATDCRSMNRQDAYVGMARHGYA